MIATRIDARRRPFPGGSSFAFTILDDTDDSTVENVRPVYDLLYSLGLRTTKTVWPLACPEGSRLYYAGQTLADASYLQFTRQLAGRGFEIAFHGATMESSRRGRSIRGLEAVKELLGLKLRIHCNHGQNRENLYWGPNRYQTPVLRVLLGAAHRTLRQEVYEGERPGSPYFWGDMAREEFSYVRSFAFRRLNTADIPPARPYRLAGTPYVNAWFVTSDAPDAAAFKRLVTKASLDDLCARGGYCILSTHLGKGFVQHGCIESQVEETLRYIAGLPGWFVTVSELLDYLAGGSPIPVLGGLRLLKLELMQLGDRLNGGRLRRGA